jgi:hypothetical protein
MAVASTCGIATAATAVLAPKRIASSGVSRLPMPKPTTDAVALAAMATSSTATENMIMESWISRVAASAGGQTERRLGAIPPAAW